MRAVIEYDGQQIEDIRVGIEYELSKHFGYPVEVRDDPAEYPDELGFRIFGVLYWSYADEAAYRRIFWSNLRRVAAYILN